MPDAGVVHVHPMLAEANTTRAGARQSAEVGDAAAEGLTGLLVCGEMDTGGCAVLPVEDGWVGGNTLSELRVIVAE